jgi:hypothetical protein
MPNRSLIFILCTVEDDFFSFVFLMKVNSRITTRSEATEFKISIDKYSHECHFIRELFVNSRIYVVVIL